MGRLRLGQAYQTTSVACSAALLFAYKTALFYDVSMGDALHGEEGKENETVTNSLGPRLLKIISEGERPVSEPLLPFVAVMPTETSFSNLQLLSSS